MLVSLLKLWGWHACAQQTEEKPLPHNFSSFMSSLCRLPVQHLWSVFCNIWFVMVQHRKQVGCWKGRKIGQNILILR